MTEVRPLFQEPHLRCDPRADEWLHPGWQLHAPASPSLLGPDRREFMVGYVPRSEPQPDITPQAAAERLRAAGGSR